MILKKRAQRLRRQTGDERIVAPLELEKTDLNHVVTVILTRPLRMICFEPLVLFTCLYLSYACQYLLDTTFYTADPTRRHFLHIPTIIPYNLHGNL
jgi:hypothetical protein